MVQFNRETLMIVAVSVCLFSCFYLYKETQKQRTELATFNSEMVSKFKQESNHISNIKNPVKIQTEVADEQDDE